MKPPAVMREMPHAYVSATVLFAVGMDFGLGAIGAVTGAGFWPLLAAATFGSLLSAGAVTGLKLSAANGYVDAVVSTEVDK